MNFVAAQLKNRGRAVARGLRMVAGVASLTLLAAACSSSGASSSSTPSGSATVSKTTYDVTIVSDLTGIYASSLGEPVAAGIKAGIQYIDSHGGVNGSQIKITQTIDSASTATGAEAAYRQALSSNPVAILGWESSSSLEAVKSLMADSTIPNITGGIDPSLLSPPAPWYYTLGSPDPLETVPMVKKMDDAVSGGVKGKTFAFVQETGTAAITDLADRLRANCQSLGCSISNSVDTPLEFPSFAAQAASIAQANPPGVFVMEATAPATVTVAQALITAGYKGPIVTFANASDDPSLQAIGSKNFFAIRSATIPDSSSALNAALSTAGGSTFSTNPWASIGFAIASTLQQGLRTCGTGCTSAKLLATLKGGLPQFNAMLGSMPAPLVFNADDHAGQTAIQFWTWNPSTKSAVISGGLYNDVLP